MASANEHLPRNNRYVGLAGCGVVDDGPHCSLPHANLRLTRGFIRMRNEVWQIDHTVVAVIVVDEQSRRPFGCPILAIVIDIVPESCGVLSFARPAVEHVRGDFACYRLLDRAARRARYRPLLARCRAATDPSLRQRRRVSLSPAACRQHLDLDLGEHDTDIGAVGVATLDSAAARLPRQFPAATRCFIARREEPSKALVSFRDEMRTIVGRTRAVEARRALGSARIKPARD